MTSARADFYGRLYGEGVKTPLPGGIEKKSVVVDSDEARRAAASVGPAHAKMHAEAINIQRRTGISYTNAYTSAYGSLALGERSLRARQGCSGRICRTGR